jgi:hypothetical protein
MNNTDIVDLLKSTGCLIEGQLEDSDEQSGWVAGAMEPLANPSAVSALAGCLSDALPSPAPDLIAAWPGLSNVVLAFAVGVQVDKPVVLLSDAEGLVTASGNVEAGQEVALVGVTLSERDANLARAFVENRGGRLAVTASLVGVGQVANELSLVSVGVGVDVND